MTEQKAFKKDYKELTKKLKYACSRAARSQNEHWLEYANILMQMIQINTNARFNSQKKENQNG